VAVTSGLLEVLDRDELQGVIAHEIGHIKNLDIRFMTLASVMMGAVLLISDLFLRSQWYGGGSYRRRRSRDDQGGAQALLLVIAMVVAILAPICAQALYFACSRKREYLADASGALFTRYPEGLASALEKIAGHAGRAASAREMNRAVAPLLTVNPLQSLSASTVFSTHPPTDKRIAVLRSMGGGADPAAYQAAYRKVVGGGPLLRSRPATQRPVAARAPSPEPKEAAAARAKEVTGLLDRMGNLIPVACPCGVTIKVPQGLDHAAVPCPRCGRRHEVPAAKEVPLEERAEAGSGPGPSGAAAPPLRFERRGTGWDSFRCACGRTIQVSPALMVGAFRCPRCAREIRIETPAGPRAGGATGKRDLELRS
jgi:heat shock protein HtpX